MARGAGQTPAAFPHDTRDIIRMRYLQKRFTVFRVSCRFGALVGNENNFSHLTFHFVLRL